MCYKLYNINVLSLILKVLLKREGRERRIINYIRRSKDISEERGAFGSDVLGLSGGGS